MNEKLELPKGSYSVSNIQDDLSISSKKHVKMIDNPPITIYLKKKTEKKDYIGLSLKSNQGIEQ